MRILVISFQSLNGESTGGTGRISFYLARQLSQLGILSKLVVSSKGKHKTDFPCVAVSPFAKYYLFVLNKVMRPMGLPSHLQRYLEEFLFDVFCRRFIKKDVDLIFSTNPYLKRTLRLARRHDIKTVFFPGNPNENAINTIIRAEYGKIGFRGTDPYSYSPRLNFYNQSVPLFHHIFCSNSLILKSFENRNCIGIKLVGGLVPPLNRAVSEVKAGVIKEGFSVGYLAYSVPLKGLHRLLDTWGHFQFQTVKLYIGGAIDANYYNFLKEKFSHLENVIFEGHISDLDAFFAKLDVFVSPSLLDGQPITVLEAMQRGVPSIVSDGCGVRDFIHDQINGFIFQNDNPQMLVQILEHMIGNPINVEETGVLARESYNKYSFDNYISGLISEVIYTV